jgi:hypothetical protein
MASKYKKMEWCRLILTEAGGGFYQSPSAIHPYISSAIWCLTKDLSTSLCSQRRICLRKKWKLSKTSPQVLNFRSRFEVYVRVFCLYLLCLFFSVSLFGSTMHLLITGDSRGAIKSSVKKDIKRIYQETKIIASKVGLKRHFKGMRNGRLSSEAILQWIKKAKVKRSDVFFFYFSGHGIKSEVDSKWPRLYFSKRRELLELKEVIGAIKRKRPRLAIILCDACNNVVHTARSRSTPGILTGINANGFRRLFIKKKGSVVICAAKPNKVAWGGQNGGLMTLGFFIQLRKEAEQPSPSWKHLIRSLKKSSSRINDPLMRVTG